MQLLARLQEAQPSEEKAEEQKQKEKQKDELAEKYGAMKNATLKDMLSRNQQLKSGNKAVLVDRIVDCIVDGCLPKCAKCGIGA